MTVESDVTDVARAAIGATGVAPTVVPPQTDAMGHTNVVFVDESGAMSAASDPRSDGAAVVVR